MNFNKAKDIFSDTDEDKVFHIAQSSCNAVPSTSKKAVQTELEGIKTLS